MPFREYSPFFRPEELDALTTAYNSAWHHLVAEASPDRLLSRRKTSRKLCCCLQWRTRARTAQRNCSARCIGPIVVLLAVLG